MIIIGGRQNSLQNLNAPDGRDNRHFVIYYTYSSFDGAAISRLRNSRDGSVTSANGYCTLLNLLTLTVLRPVPSF